MLKGAASFVEAQLDSPRSSVLLGLVALAATAVAAVGSNIAAAVASSVLFAVCVQVLILSWYFRDRYGSAYEVVDATHEWDLVSSDGRTVIHRKWITARYLQSHVRAILDRAWGDGSDLLDSYTCTPGHPADKFRFGNEAWVLISLRESRRRDDKEAFVFQRTVLDGFLSPREWIEAETEGRTRDLLVRVVFPPNRPCTRATATLKSSGLTSVLTPKHFTTQAGRQQLEYHLYRPKRNESVTIHWDW